MSDQPKESSTENGFNPLDGCTWPDPDPSIIQSSLKLNDVSGMSETDVQRIFYPQTIEDVVQIVERYPKISIRGTSHSMGGHSLVKDGVVIDLKYLNHYSVNENMDTVTVGAGCTWSDLIPRLRHKSPAILQSYATFSVGGSLSVNAHGITSDECMATSVESFRIVRCNELGKVLVEQCKPGDELFGAVLGGYGLFGVLVEVTLKLVDNTALTLDTYSSVKVTPDSPLESSEFVRIWDVCRQDPTVEIKLARLNILTLKTASVYVFRKDEKALATVSNLPCAPNGLSPVGRLLYKWAMPLLKDVRYYLEETNGKALDMPPHNFETTRNEVLYESATPLSKLYTPFLVGNDSFVLQEFFVPYGEFHEWIVRARPIFQEVDKCQREGNDKIKPQTLALLNTTIRFVNRDKVTQGLTYCRHPQGVFAFVMYFRIRRDPSVETYLGQVHNRLAEISTNLGGSFYLPYRKCYSLSLMQRAFPDLSETVRMKEKYDPRGRFANEWFTKYLLGLCSSSYQALYHTQNSSRQFINKKLNEVVSRSDFYESLPRGNIQDLTRRKNSLRVLLKNNTLRKEFTEKFLVGIFSLLDPVSVMRVISRAACDPKNDCDSKIYESIQNEFRRQASGFERLRRGWRGLRQLSIQRKELTHQAATILHRLGRFGKIRSYVSIGDHGKTVRSLHDAGLFQSPFDLFVAHDFTDKDAPAAALERCALDPIGVSIQYKIEVDDPATSFKSIPAASIDLVTMNQGLHHVPIAKLYDLLLEVRRILVDDGLFIFREHDLQIETSSGTTVTNAPVAMLDAAHIVFNAITNVSVDEESSEVRAFRPLSEWREIMTRLIGFQDTMLYGLEDSDCTCDFMMCFCKGTAFSCTKASIPLSRTLSDSLIPLNVPAINAMETILSQIPSASAQGFGTFIDWLLRQTPRLQKVFLDVSGTVRDHCLASDLVGGIIDRETLENVLNTVEKFVHAFLTRLDNMAQGIKSLLEAWEVRKISNIADLLSMKEIWLLPSLLQRYLASQPTEFQFAGLMNTIQKNFPALFIQQDGIQASVEDQIRDSRIDCDFQSDHVAKDKILEVFHRLQAEVPELKEPRLFLTQSGFSLRQQTAALAYFGNFDTDQLAEQASNLLSRLEWIELQKTLIDNNDCVATRKEPPTMQRLVDTSLNHPWHRALLCILSASKVRLTQSTMFGLKLLGLGSIADLYRTAKKGATKSYGSATRMRLPPRELERLSMFLGCFRGQAYMKRLKIQIEVNSPPSDLYDVGEIIHAEYGYTSLTSRRSDITDQLRKLHRSIHFDQRESHPVGWLPLRRETLDAFRNDMPSRRTADELRRLVVSTGTLGMAGTNLLKIEYVPVEIEVSESSVDDVCSFSQSHEKLASSTHAGQGYHMWFKQPEWMQVEIIEKLADSLNHTPWYFFPFKDTMATYFKVLFQVCNIVYQEYDLKTAYASVPFLYDLVPGAVMALVFAQLNFMASVIKVVLPPAPDPSLMIEDILLVMPLEGPDILQFLRNVIDDRIVTARLLHQSDGFGLYQMAVPTYKPMGEIIVKLGERMPAARLLQISNQKVVQVLLTVSLENEYSTTDRVRTLVSEINSIRDLDVVLQYRFPMDNQHHRQNGEVFAREARLGVKARVSRVLTLVRLVSDKDHVHVHQIFDFWS